MLCNVKCTACKIWTAFCGGILCKSVKLTEPPDAEPHVRWCERSAAKAASYSIGIFVSDEMQSCGIGKLLLDYIKNKKVRLRLNVYQKNARALSFYQREGFDIQCEGLDDATGEKEYTMLWLQK